MITLLTIATGYAFTQTSGQVPAHVSSSGSFASVAPLSGTCGGQTGVYGSQAPAWSAVVGAVGTPGGGDLYCVQVSAGRTARLRVALVNGGAMAEDYAYMHLPLGLWTWSGSAWQAPAASSEAFVSLVQPAAEFVLSGGASGATYEVALDGPAQAVAAPPATGSFDCVGTVASGLDPAFYAQVTGA